MGDIHSDLYDDVTSGGSGSYELDYKGETYEFAVTALSRARKNALLDALPEGYFDPVIDPDDLDQESLDDMDLSELRELLEEAGTSIAEFSKARTMDEEATNEVIDAMVDAYDHSKLTDTELKNLLRSSQFPDSAFEEMLITLIEVSTAGDDVREFRQES
jgi:hypothetical protein